MNFNSTTNTYAGLTKYIDKYSNGSCLGLDLTPFNRIHFEIKSSQLGYGGINLCNDALGTTNAYSNFQINTTGFASYEIALGSFVPGSGYDSTKITNIVLFHTAGNPYSFSISNIFFYNTGSSATNRIAGLNSYVVCKYIIK